MKRIWASFCYRWAMTNAYLTQYCSPMVSEQWMREADHWYWELWKIDRGMV